MSRLPVAAQAIAEGVLSPSQLAAAAAPEFRKHRRTLIEADGFREALRDAGWTRGAIRTWLRTGEAPT